MMIIPFIISGAIGYLLLGLLTKRTEPLNLALKLTLGLGLGLGLSSHLTFYSFLFFNGLEPKIIITTHLLILMFLIILWAGGAFINSFHGSGPVPEGNLTAASDPSRTRLSAPCEKGTPSASPEPNIFSKNFTIIFISIFAIVITGFVIQQALFFPYGGWDAWQVWNFKAKFLLLAGDRWKDLFSPELWRSSPHYPLLLPLINVWAWLFTQKPLDVVPMITSVGFTFLTIGLMCSAIWQRTRNIFSLAPGFLLLTLPFYNLLATTQYCDIVLSFCALAALVTLSLSEKNTAFALISGVFAGMLGFTKPEGLVAALIVSALMAALTLRDLLTRRKTFTLPKAGLFILGFIVASLPTFAFNVLCSPGNQTFINGLTSTLKPATIQRLQMIFGYFGVELISTKWNGLWVLLLLGIILGGKTLWTKNKITAGFLGLYLAVIIAYYEINTYFEIKWWLSVSLNRILFSLLPLFFFWVFSGILPSNEKKED